jgi:hypothetical protein
MPPVPTVPAPAHTRTQVAQLGSGKQECVAHAVHTSVTAFTATPSPQFTMTYEGHYKSQSPKDDGGSGTRIVLLPFASGPGGERKLDPLDTPDGAVARAAIPALMRKLDAVGHRLCRPLLWGLKLLTGMPSDPSSAAQVDKYIRTYANSHLLTEQVGARQGAGLQLSRRCFQPAA